MSAPADLYTNDEEDNKPAEGGFFGGVLGGALGGGADQLFKYPALIAIVTIILLTLLYVYYYYKSGITMEKVKSAEGLLAGIALFMTVGSIYALHDAGKTQLAALQTGRVAALAV